VAGVEERVTGIEAEAWVEGGELLWRLMEGWTQREEKLFSGVEGKHRGVVTIPGQPWGGMWCPAERIVVESVLSPAVVLGVSGRTVWWRFDLGSLFSRKCFLIPPLSRFQYRSHLGGRFLSKC